MSVAFEAPGVVLHHGDCIEVMRTLPDASVDAVVTDPPYGLEFMGKDWDGADGFRRSLNEADAGRESVFGRTSRTSPEYRTESKARAGMQKGGISAADGMPSFLGGLNPKCLACGKWQRGSNPCSCDAPEFTNERLPRLHAFQEWCEAWSREALRVLRPGGFILAFGGSRTWHRLAAAIEDAGFEIRDSIAWLYGSGFPKHPNVLKPAFEPIVVGRKPMIGTLVANQTRYRTGALNIDANRTEVADTQLAEKYASVQNAGARSNTVYGSDERDRAGSEPHPGGRWPTNVLVDGSSADDLGMNTARYFPTFRYEPKAGSDERPSVDGVLHPTVKPLELMRWLVRLVTPAEGTILEPFAGSGTTLEAALLEGFNVIGIERATEYLPLIEARLSKPLQVAMFGDWEDAS
ncbi:DNA-methyltransferase [Microbacterium aurantiacum]|uniref:DNA-methyltransferase n=1 Tax=Microbacterium aurantiacum TaxID=162393 RepID=UPI00342A7B41